MKNKILTILFLLFISFKGFSDTLDFWHVFINDSLIAKFNSASKDVTIKLNKSLINENSNFRIEYFTDAPCSDCVEHIYLLSKKNKKISLSIKNHKSSHSVLVKKVFQENYWEIFRTFRFKYSNKEIKSLILIIQIE